MPKTNTMDAWLKKAGKSWKKDAKAGKELKRGSDVDDGTYVARLREVKLEFADGGKGRPQSVWRFVILDGESGGESAEGKKVWKYDGLDQEQSLQYAAKDLSTLGIDPEEVGLEDLPEIYEELTEAKPVCKIVLRTKGEFQNVYINKLLEDWDEDEDESDDEDEEETPKKKSKKTEAKSTKKSKKDEEEDEDEDEEEEDDDSDEDEDDEEEEDEDEDDEEEEAPKKKSKTKAKPEPKSKKKAKEEPKATSKSKPKKDEDEDEDEEEEDEATLAVGSTVEFKLKGQVMAGKVKSFDEKTAKVRVVQDGKGVVHSVPTDKLTILDDDED